MNKAFCCFVLYLIAMTLRVFWLDSTSPQADEHHWQERSFRIVQNYRDGNFVHLTTHLGQPGIPANLTIAAGQVLGDKYNEWRNFKFGDSGHFSRFISGRLAISAVNSLLIPAVFLLLVPLSNKVLAFSVALFLAFDPQNIAYSRIMHLDGMLTYLATLTAGIYFFAVEKGSTLLKLLAGFFWGLCIAVKPTAGALILAFLIFKIFRRFMARDGDRSIVNWGDIWAVVIGHAVLSLLYTRTWHRPWDYVERMGIENPLREPLYSLSMWLRANEIVTAGLGLIFLILFSWLFFKLRSRHVLGVFSVTAVILAVFLLVPAVVENLILYWTWAFGLRNKYHIAYGAVWFPPDGGYPGMLFSRHPDLLSISLVVGALVGLPRLLFVRKTPLDRFVLLSVIVVICWIVPLSVAGKQSLRYAQPAIPFLYVIAGSGSYFLFRYLFKIVPPAVYFSILLASGVISWSVYEFANWGPDHQLYCSQLSGGLKEAVNLKRPIPFSGHRELLEFLDQDARKKDRSDKIYAAADLDSFNFAYRRFFKPEDRRLKFVHSMDPRPGYYFMVAHHFYQVKHGKPEALENLEHVFSHAPMGVPLTSIYKVPLNDYSSPLEIEFLDLPRKVGKPEYFHEDSNTFVEQEEDHSHRVLYLSPDLGERKGLVFYGESYRFPKGEFSLKFKVRVPPSEEQEQRFTPEDLAFKVMLGDCDQVVTFADLGKDDFQQIEMSCSFEEGQGASLKTYWFGKVPLMITDFSIVRPNSDV